MNEGRRDAAELRNQTAELTGRIFHLQESALLMLGGDRLERLNQLHAQISVLRGAAFNGMLMCAFCLFGMCANHDPQSVSKTVTQSLSC